MFKKVFSVFSLLTLLFSCSNETASIEQEPIQRKFLSRQQINDKINKTLQSTGEFDWSKQDANTILSAVNLGDNLLTVGYGTSVNTYAKSTDSKILQEGLINLIRTTEEIDNTSSKRGNELYSYENINVFDIKVTNIKTIQSLLKDSRVRYIEPAGYDFTATNNNVQERSSSSSGSSGCGYDAAVLTTADYRTVAPGGKVPWAFDKHNIPAAWNYSTGAGVSIAIVDTGLSPQQALMNQNFNDGYSSGRFVQKYGTFVDSWWAWSNNYDGVNDKCGHGTSMASVATAPRNNDGLPVGVAYNANLVSYRAVENVVINDYHEKRGISEALTALGNRGDVKVISMSVGWPFGINKVKDAVRYAYNRGKMVIAAGGTSTSFTKGFGVIFPASMNETVAVTGVKENQTTNECDVCHKGSKIDFTVQMQRTNGTDNTVPVLSYYNGQSDYVGGSSVATAMTAGIAALVWSKHPTWSREQVLNKMKQSAEFYPYKNSNFGYGNIDALQAVQ